MKTIKRTDKEISDLLQKCDEANDTGSKYFGMNYEQGVEAGIKWLIGETDDHPMDGE